MAAKVEDVGRFATRLWSTLKALILVILTFTSIAKRAHSAILTSILEVRLLFI